MFWNYIRTKLAFIPVLKQGPLSALVNGAAKSLDTARGDILAVREAMMPETAAPNYLAVIARQRGIVKWPDEAFDAFRVRVTIARLYWRTGGNPFGLCDILNAFGYRDIDVIEHTGKIWAEMTVAMKMDLAHAVPNTSYLVRLINDIKPARSRLRGLNLFSHESMGLNAGPTVVRTHTQNKTTTRYDGLTKLAVCGGCVVGGGQRSLISGATRASPVESHTYVGGVLRGVIQTGVRPVTQLKVRFGVRADCLVKTTIRCEIEG